MTGLPEAQGHRGTGWVCLYLQCEVEGLCGNAFSESLCQGEKKRAPRPQEELSGRRSVWPAPSQDTREAAMCNPRSCLSFTSDKFHLRGFPSALRKGSLLGFENVLGDRVEDLVTGSFSLFSKATEQIKDHTLQDTREGAQCLREGTPLCRPPLSPALVPRRGRESGWRGWACSLVPHGCSVTNPRRLHRETWSWL